MAVQWHSVYVCVLEDKNLSRDKQRNFLFVASSAEMVHAGKNETSTR